MELRWIENDGVRQADLAERADLRRRTHGFCWLDIPTWSDVAE